MNQSVQGFALGCFAPGALGFGFGKWMISAEEFLEIVPQWRYIGNTTSGWFATNGSGVWDGPGWDNDSWVWTVDFSNVVPHGTKAVMCSVMGSSQESRTLYSRRSGDDSVPANHYNLSVIRTCDDTQTVQNQTVLWLSDDLKVDFRLSLGGEFYAYVSYPLAYYK